MLNPVLVISLSSSVTKLFSQNLFEQNFELDLYLSLSILASDSSSVQKILALIYLSLF